MIEKILERLEEEKQRLEYQKNFFGERKNEDVVEEYGLKIFQMERVLKIVQEVAKEYGKDTNVRSKGWIPTEEMLFPRYGQKVLASVKCEDCKHEVIITTYERQEYWHNGIITAWKPLDAPYQTGE